MHTKRTTCRGFSALSLATILVCQGSPASAEITVVDGAHPVKLQVDGRLRYETDWDSHRANGVLREDRARLRLRARVGATVAVSDVVQVGARVRTGSRDSQQSPHITFVDFADNPHGDAHVLLDKWYVNVNQAKSWAWFGRNAFPFWKQNELFWDDDVTPAGAAVSSSVYESEQMSLHLTGGYFALPDGGVRFNGNLTAAQLRFERNRDRGLTIAVGGYRFTGEDGARHLLDDNGGRDYTIVASSAQLRTKLAERPLRLGIDAMFNLKDYKGDSNAFTAAHTDDTEGLVLSVQWGATKKSTDYLLGYSYAAIEALAVNASYAQDDWLRWGSATQTTASDIKGHELRFAMRPWRALELMARLYIVEAISSSQDGKRFRVDWNYSF